MFDGNLVKDQITEFQKLVNECMEEDMIMNEKYQSTALIEKLPPS